MASASAKIRTNPIRYSLLGAILILKNDFRRASPARDPKVPRLFFFFIKSIQLQVKLDQDTVWLTQKQLADLFGVKKAAISKHVSNIFTSGELDPLATVSKMETVVNRGFRGVVKDWIDYYKYAAPAI